MCLTQMAQSSRVGSGTFDKLPGSAGAEVQQELEGFVYEIRGKNTLFLFCMHTRFY